MQIEIASVMTITMMTPHSTPIHLSIPPIMIPEPIVQPERSPPQPERQQPERQQPILRTGYPQKQVQKVYYDFPSPVRTYFSSCDVCNISFEYASTRDNEICVSCEVIQDNHRWHKTPLPKCSICETECYYIHRECNRPICRHCKYNFQAWPYCKYPIL